jgi:uncharacterized protein (DUF885 family)
LSLFVLGSACVRPATAPPPTLAELIQGYERETSPYFPFTASERGLHEYDRVLANDIGDDWMRGLKEICTRYRGDLRRVDAGALSAKDRVTYDVFAYRRDLCVESFAYPWTLVPVNQVGFSWPTRFPVLGAGRGVHPFKTVQNYEDFLGRVDSFDVWMDTAIANMRRGQARGITLPRDLVLRVSPQLDAQIVDNPETSLFWEPIKDFPSSCDDAARRTLEAKYRHAIQDQIARRIAGCGTSCRTSICRTAAPRRASAIFPTGARGTPGPCARPRRRT